MSIDVTERLRAVHERTAQACRSVGRDPADVRVLLAVKTQPADVVGQALAAGARLLGHNRAQELTAMGPKLAERGVPEHEMHFIGHLQGNKVNQVLRWVSCVQSVDSARLAARLQAAVGRRADQGEATTPLDVFVQVNTSGEATKAGVSPDAALDLACTVGAAEHLRLRGLMTVGAHSSDSGVVRGSYERLSEVRAAVVGSGEPGTADAGELSMGMSGDVELAVAAGATMIRVGTAVFGARPTAPAP